MSTCSQLSGLTPVSEIHYMEWLWCETHLDVTNLCIEWSIDNFDMYILVDGCLKSHIFPEEGGHDNIKWMLELYPKGTPDNPAYMSLYLRLVSSDREKVSACFEFALIDSEGQFQCVKWEQKIHEFTPGSDSGYDKFVKRSEVRPDSKLLTLNRLKIRCILRMIGGSSTRSGKCSKFSLKRSDRSLSKAMGKMFESQKFCDVVLVGCDGVELPAHKALLASRSKVFASMFDHQMKENIQNRVEISDLSSDVLREVLRYIYTGECSNLSGVVHDLLTAADKYALSGLKEQCEELLSRDLTIESAAEVYVLADMHGSAELKAFVSDFICGHAADFLESSGWENLLVQHPALVNEISRAIALGTGGPPHKKIKPPKD